MMAAPTIAKCNERLAGIDPPERRSVIRFEWESLNFQMALSSDDVPMHVENSEKRFVQQPIPYRDCFRPLRPEDQHPSLTNNSNVCVVCRRAQAAGKGLLASSADPKIIAAPALFRKSWNKNTPARCSR